MVSPLHLVIWFEDAQFPPPKAEDLSGYAGSPGI
jgi:hypothetical protein